MNLFICQTIAIGCGYILDLLIGDPHWLYHPVRLIGNLISLLESILLKEKDTSAKKYRKGMVLAILTPLITGIVIVSILVVGYHINMILGCVIETIMCYQILAVKSLKVESMKVYYALDKEGLQKARNAVAMIVGRDTKQLDEHGVECSWEMVERKGQEQLARESIPPVLFRLVEFMQDKEKWCGTATELLAAMAETDTPPTVITKWLNEYRTTFLADNHIGYAYRRKKEGRLIALTKQAGDSDDGGDGDVGIPPISVTGDTAE